MSSLTPRSALQNLALPGRSGTHSGPPGIILSERKGLALATVLARKGQASALVQRVREMYSVVLPTIPQRAASGNVAFVWSGPDHWLAVAEAESGREFENALRQVFSDMASVSDQSDGRAVIRVSGARARDLLAKGIPLDLHPREFKPGSAALTIAGHIGVQIWQLDNAPTYEIAMFRGFAESFWRWLVDAAAEFGVSVEGPDLRGL